MKQKNFTAWLKFITIIVGLIGTVVFLIVVPNMGQSIALKNPEYSYAYYPWLIFIWTMAIPCYMVLGFFWDICNEIKMNHSFSEKNIKSLIWISRLAVFDTIYCFVGNTILLLIGISHPGVFLGFLFVVFIGICIAIISAALSHLAKKASMIEEENELTI